MLDELISGFVGATIAEFVSKVAPPRSRSRFDDRNLHERNSTIYWLAGIISGSTFIGIFLYLTSGGWRDPWQIGLLFGLPFLSMAFFPLLRCVFSGFERGAEFLRYFELRYKTNLWVLIAMFAPFALLGAVSFIVELSKLI